MRILTLGTLTLDPSAKLPKKAILLLAYLADRCPRNRHRLADLLWGDHQGVFAAHHSLRQVLLDVRKAAPAILDADFTTVRLMPSVTSDIAQLRLAYRDNDHHAVARLHRGPFLGGADVPPAMEDWLSATRQEVDDIAHDALCSLAENAATPPREALSCALRALRIDTGPRSQAARNAALERAGRSVGSATPPRPSRGDPYRELVTPGWKFD